MALETIKSPDVNYNLKRLETGNIDNKEYLDSIQVYLDKKLLSDYIGRCDYALDVLKYIFDENIIERRFANLEKWKHENKIKFPDSRRVKKYLTTPEMRLVFNVSLPVYRKKKGFPSFRREYPGLVELGLEEPSSTEYFVINPIHMKNFEELLYGKTGI